MWFDSKGWEWGDSMLLVWFTSWWIRLVQLKQSYNIYCGPIVVYFVWLPLFCGPHFPMTLNSMHHVEALRYKNENNGGPMGPIKFYMVLRWVLVLFRRQRLETSGYEPFDYRVYLRDIIYNSFGSVVFIYKYFKDIWNKLRFFYIIFFCLF